MKLKQHLIQFAGTTVVLAALSINPAQAASSAVSTSMVQNGPAQIEVLAQGKGPTIVLLTSLGRGQDDFDIIAADLAKAGFRVLRPQVRGIGKSTGPTTGLTLHDLAADVAAAIVSDNHGKPHEVIIAGHAFGSFVGRMLATDRPDLTRAVVLMAAGAGKVPSPPDARQAIKDSANDKLSEEDRLRALQFVFFAPGNDPHIWLKGWHSDVLNMQREAGDATPGPTYFAGGGVAPILDIQPTQDRIAPVSDSEIVKNELAPRVTVVLVEHTGHAMIVEKPNEVSRALVAWTRKLPKVKD
jgi:pimeloyl-ACP methyl ester carboxylesterase